MASETPPAREGGQSVEYTLGNLRAVGHRPLANPTEAALRFFHSQLGTRKAAVGTVTYKTGIYKTAKEHTRQSRQYLGLAFRKMSWESFQLFALRSDARTRKGRVG